MLYDRSHATAVLCPPRTGSRSVYAHLQASGFFEPADKPGGRHAVHNDVLAGAERVVVTVRNHWSALASWWGGMNATTGEPLIRDAYSLEHPDDFSGWLKHWFFAGEPSDAKQYAPPRMWGTWLPHATHVVRFERLIQDMRGAVGWVDWFRAPHIQDRKRPVKWTQEAIDLVSAAYAEEILELGYAAPQEGRA